MDVRFMKMFAIDSEDVDSPALKNACYVVLCRERWPLG